MIVIIAAIYYLCPQLNPKDKTFNNPRILTEMLLAVAFGSSLIQHPKKPVRSDIKMMDINLMIINISLLSLVTYLGSIYPNLPQEMGGAKPRCAQLDILPEKLSTATLNNLIENSSVAQVKGGIKTRKLWVLFSGGDRIIALLDPLVNPQEHKFAHNKLIELKQSSISAISWCE